MQHSPGGQRIDLQHRRLLRRDLLRHGDQFIGLDHAASRHVPKSCGRMTCVPTAELCTDRADFFHDARAFKSGRGGQRGTDRIFPFDLVEVGRD